MNCPPGLDLSPFLDPYECRILAAGAVAPNWAYSITNAFSFDTPVIASIHPVNAPPFEYVVLTITGKNFGPFLDDDSGPLSLLPRLPGSSSPLASTDFTGLGSLWRVERIDPKTSDSLQPTRLLVSYGVQAYALALYPFRDYYKTLHLEMSNPIRAAKAAGGLEFVCVSEDLEYDGKPCLCIGGRCNTQQCGRPDEENFNCRAARYLCVRNVPRQYTECGSKAGRGLCKNLDKGENEQGLCQLVYIGMGGGWQEEKCQPHHQNFDIDQCVPQFMQQACKPAVQPDGTSCEVAPEFSENQALCKSRQHGFVAGTECVTYMWISDSSCCAAQQQGSVQTWRSLFR